MRKNLFKTIYKDTLFPSAMQIGFNRIFFGKNFVNLVAWFENKSKKQK